MNAFLSYSVGEHDRYFVTLLANALRSNGFTVSSSANTLTNIVSYSTFQAIAQSGVVVGLITSEGRSLKQVETELDAAVRQRIPILVALENNTLLNVGGIPPSNIIRFSRGNLESAVQYVQQQLLRVKGERSSSEAQTGTSNNALAWLLGGAAVLALLTMLSDEE